MSEHLDRLDRERVMSESSARAERRDLRRAMGPHVQAFASDTKQAIQILQASLQKVHQELQVHENLIDVVLRDIAELQRDIIALQYRSRWERLRGFLIGR